MVLPPAFDEHWKSLGGFIFSVTPLALFLFVNTHSGRALVPPSALTPGESKRGGYPCSGVCERDRGRFHTSPVGSLHILLDSSCCLAWFRLQGRRVVQCDLINSFIFNFLFWNNHRLPRSCKNSTGRSAGPRTQLPLTVTSTMHYENQEIIGIMQLTRLQTLLRCHHFFACTDFLFWHVFVDHRVTRLFFF